MLSAQAGDVLMHRHTARWARRGQAVLARCGEARYSFAMPSTRTLFATSLYEADLSGEHGFGSAGFVEFNNELGAACLLLAEEDGGGRAWARENRYPGYTSYASLNDLPTRATVFGDLKRRLDRHAAAFSDELAFNLGGRKLKLDSLWANVLGPNRRSGRGVSHSGHLHPHSVISGTIYVSADPGVGPIRFEDPRLPMMMAAPPRRSDAPEPQRVFITVEPRPGMLLFWESWLRHEVLAGAPSRTPRISLSFNYAWR